MNYPGAIYTNATGISGNIIVGICGDSTGNHGFIYNNGVWSSLDYPGATLTRPLGISGNTIVGNFHSYSFPDSQGFIYTIPEPPMIGFMKITPQTINRKSNQRRIQVVIRLPDDSQTDIDTGELLSLYPGEIKAVKQSLSAGNGICAEFDKDALMAAVPNGDIELKVVGKLKTGQLFFAVDTVKIIH